MTSVMSRTPVATEQTINLLAISHEHGIDFAAYRDPAQVDAHLATYVATWWDEEIASPLPEPVPTPETVEAYFEHTAMAEGYLRGQATVVGAVAPPEVGDTVYVVLFEIDYNADFRAYLTEDLARAAIDADVRERWPDAPTPLTDQDIFDFYADYGRGTSVTIEAVTVRDTVPQD